MVLPIPISAETRSAEFMKSGPFMLPAKSLSPPRTRLDLTLTTTIKPPTLALVDGTVVKPSVMVI